MKTFFALGTALALALAGPATAAKITYTLSGTLSGSFDGIEFTGADAVFTAIGDTDDATGAFGNPQSVIVGVPITSITAMSGGNAFTITSPTTFIKYDKSLFNTAGSRLGLSFDDTGVNGLGLESSAFDGYDGLSSFATTAAATYFENARFNSSAGQIVITSFTNGSFGAVLDASAAVPEPATWGMMLVGFGLVGVGMRRRNATTVVA